MKTGLLRRPTTARARPPRSRSTTPASSKTAGCGWRSSGSKCVFLPASNEMYLPVAHAEGKFVAARRASAANCCECRAHRIDDMPHSQTSSASARIATIRNPHYATSVPYPDNPNGAIGDVAGICDATGRVFGLMPHPERFIDPTQHPQWTREPQRERRRRAARVPERGAVFHVEAASRRLSSPLSPRHRLPPASSARRGPVAGRVESVAGHVQRHDDPEPASDDTGPATNVAADANARPGSNDLRDRTTSRTTGSERCCRPPAAKTIPDASLTCQLRQHDDGKTKARRCRGNSDWRHGSLCRSTAPISQPGSGAEHGGHAARTATRRTSR